MKTNSKRIISMSMVLVMILSGLIVITTTSSAGFTGDIPTIKNKIQPNTRIIEQVDTHLEKLLLEFDQDPDPSVLADVESELQSIKSTAQKIVYNVEPYLKAPDNQQPPGNTFDNIDFGKLTPGTVGQLHAINVQLANTEEHLNEILIHTWAPEGDFENGGPSILGSIHSDAMYLQNSAESILDMIRERDSFMICTPHEPIQILSNSDFTAANGVTGGSGTSSDPYIIERWNIDASTAIGIDIRNTNAHFVIRYVCIHSGRFTGMMGNDGIFIRDSSNGIIETSRIWENDDGIFLYYTSDMRIDGNRISDNYIYGINLEYSPNAEIVNNDIFGNGVAGLRLEQSHYNVITENDLHGNEAYGIFIRDSIDGTITQNRLLENTFTGIATNDSENIAISENDAIENGLNGMSITSSNEIEVIDNLVTFNGDTGIGIYDGSLNIQIEENRILNNGNDPQVTEVGHGVVIVSSSEIVVENNFISSNYGQGVGVSGDSSNIRILSNAILNNRGFNAAGVYVFEASDVIIRCNEIRYHIILGPLSIAVGIYVLDPVTDVKVFNNNILNNSIAAIDYNSGSTWDDGYPSGGNYWGDFGDVDSFSGPAQDVPGSDGIMDDPIYFEWNQQDRYPLMEPCRNSFWNMFWMPSQQLTIRVNRQLISNQRTLGRLGQRLESTFEASDSTHDDATIDEFESMRNYANSISEQITEKLGDNPQAPPPNFNQMTGDRIPNEGSKHGKVANKIAANTKILVQVDSRLESILDNINGEPDKATAAALSAMRDAANSIVIRINEILGDFPVPPPPTD
jgi:parallel beta-helix repeat protein